MERNYSLFPCVVPLIGPVCCSLITKLHETSSRFFCWKRKWENHVLLDQFIKGSLCSSTYLTLFVFYVSCPFCLSSHLARMYSSRMRAARLFTISCSAWGSTQPPGCRPLPLDADSPDADPSDADPLWMQTPLDTDPPGHVTCDACWEANSPPPMNRMTHRCKNYLLTSFADGKYVANLSSFKVFNFSCICLNTSELFRFRSLNTTSDEVAV